MTRRQTYGCLGHHMVFVKRADIMSWISATKQLDVLIIYTWAGSMAWADWVLTDAVELTHSRVFSYHMHGLGQQELPIQWHIQYVTLYPNSNFKNLKEIWLDASCTYLLVWLSSRSQRSSATRKTDFSLMGSEMEWTRPSNTSSTSSWLLHTWAHRSVINAIIWVTLHGSRAQSDRARFAGCKMCTTLPFEVLW